MSEDKAAQRFWLLQLVRLSAAALAVLGGATIGERTGLPEAVGPILLVVGAASFFFLPRALVRRWKSPDK